MTLINFNHKLISNTAVTMSSPLLISLALLAVAVCVANSAPAPQIPVTLSQLNNQEFISRKIRCVLDEAPCDNLGQKLKDLLPTIINTGCADCSPFVKANVTRLVRYAQVKYPEDWAKIKVKYSKK